MPFYDARIEFKNVEMRDKKWKKDPTYRQMSAIIETAFLNAGWELTEEGVQIINED